jgi:hypothetical protein
MLQRIRTWLDRRPRLVIAALVLWSVWAVYVTVSQPPTSSRRAAIFALAVGFSIGLWLADLVRSRAVAALSKALERSRKREGYLDEQLLRVMREKNEAARDRMELLHVLAHGDLERWRAWLEKKYAEMTALRETR